MIYLDNAATSFPKPPAVISAIAEFMTTTSASPGRSGHSLSVEAARRVFEVRELLGRFFGVADSSRVVFTANATHSLNLVFHGLLRRGDRVVTSSMEHNSVTRPLNYLTGSAGVTWARVRADAKGLLDPADVDAELHRAPTRLLAVCGASNVTGTIQDVSALSEICHRHGAVFLVDAAQMAGSMPIDCRAMGIDMLAFTGHKALYGPTGIGGLIVGEGIDLAPLLRGGTGSRSEREEHPDFLPDRLEAGTPNSVGIVGLGAGVGFINEAGLARIRGHEIALIARLLAGFSAIPGVRVHGPAEASQRTPVVSVTIDGLLPSEIGFLLDTSFDVKVRVGLHCSPAAHRTIGTFPDGTVRFAPGYFTTTEEIDQTIAAIERLATKVRR